jgi:hypothetical protein
VAYHLAFFRTINPAATIFAALCVGTAGAFAILGGLRGGMTFHKVRNGRDLLGWAMIAYALLGYPAVGALAGHTFPNAPTFGLPCPTTLFTFGLLLLAAPGLHRALVIGPLIWALIGGTAAFSLGVPQDYGLFVAAAIGFYLLFPRAERTRRAAVASAN